jgi:hypothetical protein
LAALLCLSACGGVVSPEEASATTAQMTEQTQEEMTTTKAYPPPKPPEVVNTDYVFTITWAKTPTHFFATYLNSNYERTELSRFPLSNISKPEKLSLPKEYKGHKISRLNICGVTEQWLFVDCDYEKREGDISVGFTWSNVYVLFRISLETLKAEVVKDDENYTGNTWYNAGSNSLIVRKDSRAC